ARAADRVADWTDTAVLFISPHRGAAEIGALATRQPERPAVLFRELTKTYETAIRGTLRSLAEQLAQDRPKGEWTLVLGPVAANADESERLHTAVEEAQAAVADGQSPRQAAFAVAERLGVPGRRVYRELLRHLSRDGHDD
ncbi:MAG: 16S rRNA (cytidine(1402)-2'-O)-methyltransferase, partial [Candidatus Dadabacteria bacterium]